jgi:hypothetical protein
MPNDPTVAHHSIATPHRAMDKESTVVRRARSANIPNRTEATALTTELTATRSPMSALLMLSDSRS